MPAQQGIASAHSARLEALRHKHKKLSHKIEVEQNHYILNDAEIKALKLEKLRVKEEIEGIQETS
jgi:hypothetical protein